MPIPNDARVWNTAPLVQNISGAEGKNVTSSNGSTTISNNATASAQQYMTYLSEAYMMMPQAGNGSLENQLPAGSTQFEVENFPFPVWDGLAPIWPTYQQHLAVVPGFHQPQVIPEALSHSQTLPPYPNAAQTSTPYGHMVCPPNQDYDAPSIISNARYTSMIEASPYQQQMGPRSVYGQWPAYVIDHNGFTVQSPLTPKTQSGTWTAPTSSKQIYGDPSSQLAQSFYGHTAQFPYSQQGAPRPSIQHKIIDDSHAAQTPPKMGTSYQHTTSSTVAVAGPSFRPFTDPLPQKTLRYRVHCRSLSDSNPVGHVRRCIHGRIAKSQTIRSKSVCQSAANWWAGLDANLKGPITDEQLSSLTKEDTDAITEKIDKILSNATQELSCA